MLKLKGAHIAWLALAALLVSACSSTKPQSTTLHVPSKHQKKIPQEDSEEEDDGYIDTGPDVERANLPLAGTQWNWEGYSDNSQYLGPNQKAIYQLKFKTNGWFEFEADCKHGAGMYEITGTQIALAIIKATRKACKEASLADEFINTLENARRFRQLDDKLYLDLKGKQGTSIFASRFE